MNNEDELLGTSEAIVWPGNENWRSIAIEHGELGFNQYGKPLFRKCNWCGADGLYVVTRTSQLSQHTYTDYACSKHARGWMPPGGADRVG